MWFNLTGLDGWVGCDLYELPDGRRGLPVSEPALITDSTALCAGLLTPHSADRSVSSSIGTYGRVSARSGDLR